jgi:signal transduction histidine kinase/CheY-like chemotaxis protein
MAASRRDLLLERRDGSRVVVDETAAPIRSRGGRTTGVVLICRDVSERSAAETALREVEAQLRQAQKLEAVGRLAGGVAHDINNYLGAIANQGTLIKILRPGDAEVAENVDILLGTVDRTSSLIKRLLAFGRKQPVRREVVSLNRIIEELGDLMERLIGDEVELVVRLAQRPWNLEIDPAQLEQVLVNLLVNAREAMPRGGKIFVETRNVALSAREVSELGLASPGDYAVLSVRDTGEGISASVREKIFEPFFTTKGERGSSGLGLSTVYGIVRRFEGVIQVESTVGQGSELRVYLPRTERDPTWVAPPRRSLAAMESLHILLVEDHDDFRRSIHGMLVALGHRVETASDGEAALALHRRPPGGPADGFDLVITDVLMPGLSGKEVAERLLRDEPELPLILMSGFTDRVVVEDLLRRPNVGFVTKPFTAAELTDVMARLLGERQSSAQQAG